MDASETHKRIAIVSSPRSGNTWLRHLLHAIYQAPSIAFRDPDEVEWPDLPPRCIIQIHRPPDSGFVRLLDEHGFQTVSLARHPLDVLISSLHWYLVSGSAPSLFGAMPRSTAFLEYAAGPKAAKRLSISRLWWHEPDCLKLRYEDLVADSQAALQRLVGALGMQPQNSIETALAESSMDRLRESTGNKYHFWQGQPGIWKSLLTETEANHIASVHPACFTELGYSCDPDSALTAARADNNWISLAWQSIGKDFRGMADTHRRMQEMDQRLQRLAPITKLFRWTKTLVRPFFW